MKKFVCVVCSLLIVSGCGLSKRTEKSASELVTEGRQEFQDEDYRDAVESFKQLKNWYPFSEYVKEAEINIADSYFEMKKYEEAILAYSDFEKLHPLSKNAEKSAFRIGVCYYKQILTIDRDQTFTEKALSGFRRFLAKYPDSKYVDKAVKYSGICIDKLAEADLYVAKFYLKQKSYAAAKARLIELKDKYKDTKAGKEAVSLIEKFKKELNK